MRTLHTQELPSNIILKHVIVDDGSTDGTSEQIQLKFPSVKILKGNGNLYWAGGMRYGWNNYIMYEKFDLLFVYNDDTILFMDALRNLIHTYNESFNKYKNEPIIVVGSCLSSCKKFTTYGGQLLLPGFNPLRFKRCDPDKSLSMSIDTLNMNCALINNECLVKFGFLAKYFPHSMADFEYGLRVKKKNGNIILAKSYHGICDRNNDLSYKSLSNASDYLRWITSIKNKPILPFFKFYREYGGIFWFLHFIKIYFNKIFLKLLLKL